MRSERSATASLFTGLLACAALAAQQHDFKPAPVPDPVKGMHDLSPLTPAEHARLHAAPGARGGGPVIGEALSRRPADLFPTVLFDQPGDGRIWARGASYKASFGAEGFVYVPDFGAKAPQDYPVRFVLRAVRVGGRDVDFATDVPAGRTGNRVTFDRGIVQEHYDLTPTQVEQTFVVADATAGDVELDLEVVSELREDAARAGLQFGNTLGEVAYGTAYLVDGTSKRAIASTFEAGRIALRVPAAQRGAGAVVIDPIIHTSAFTSNLGQDSRQPDIAYDVTSDQYLVVWEYHFSASDVDVYSEFRRGDGSAVSGSLGIIDATTLSHSVPRVANLNAYDRFLVVMQRFEAGRWQIWGRLRLAGSAAHPIVFPISDPAFSGHCINPDVGGDSADTGACDQFLVAWQRELSATDFDIHARLVRADIALAPATILIENSGSSIHSMPQVSQSNGNGFTTTPRWLVVYQFRFSATDSDVYGAAIAQNGTITQPNTAIDTSTLNDLVPCVSSPATEFSGGNPIFMVTYERQAPLEARARVLSAGFVNQIPPVNLTQSFGLGGFWVRPECDGYRFAVISGASTITVATLAMGTGALVLHEAPQPLLGVPSYPRIAAKRSGGGARTDFGIAFVDEQPAPDRILVSAYRGHAPGADVTRRTMACGGLGIDVAGRPFLGEELRFSLTNTRSDLTGYLLGVPSAQFPLCLGCSLGVSLGGPLLHFPNLGTLPLPIPNQVSFVGVTLAVQAYGVGSGTCLTTMRFSDTLDFTIG